MNSKGSEVYIKPCNIRNEDQVKDLVGYAILKFGKLDFLVNNGGGQFLGQATNFSLKGWNAVVETNLTGTFLMCREVFNQWMGQHGGVIINIVADYFRGIPLMSHTGAARAAVDNLTKSLAIEWAHKGVRIVSVAPGSNIYSPTAASNYGDMNVFEQIRPEVPMKRLGTTQEVASAVSFLLSPGASFITGTTLKVDGGSSLYSRLLWNIPEHKTLPAYQGISDKSESVENTTSKL